MMFITIFRALFCLRAYALPLPFTPRQHADVAPLFDTPARYHYAPLDLRYADIRYAAARYCFAAAVICLQRRLQQRCRRYAMPMFTPAYAYDTPDVSLCRAALPLVPSHDTLLPLPRLPPP